MIFHNTIVFTVFLDKVDATLVSIRHFFKHKKDPNF